MRPLSLREMCAPPNADSTTSISCRRAQLQRVLATILSSDRRTRLTYLQTNTQLSKPVRSAVCRYLAAARCVVCADGDESPGARSGHAARQGKSLRRAWHECHLVEKLMPAGRLP